MKIRDGFILQEIAGDMVVLPTEADCSMMITLNGTGSFLWKQLEQETTKEALVEALLAEYEVDTQTAAECVEKFVGELEKNGFLA